MAVVCFRLLRPRKRRRALCPPLLVGLGCSCVQSFGWHGAFALSRVEVAWEKGEGKTP